MREQLEDLILTTAEHKKGKVIPIDGCDCGACVCLRLVKESLLKVFGDPPLRLLVSRAA